MIAKEQTDYTHFRARLLAGEVSCKEEVERFLANISAENEGLNAFLEVWADEALTRADEVDLQIKQGKIGALSGMVIALKDNICYQNHKVSASSKILSGFTSLYSATVVERLLNEGAILIGRCNCDEFAMGASNENSAYGVVKNAADRSRVPGGSSGGSAVAVQAGFCHAALGSDTGGSIRQPAAFTGLVGFKPTYGTISRYGLIAYASSFDQIGPITNSVGDAQLLMQTMAGKDEHDATMIQANAGDYTQKPSGMKKLAYFKDCIENEGIDPRLAKAFLEGLSTLQAAGYEVEALDFPYLDYLVPCYYVLTTAEASSNLSRFQGLQYGYRSSNATDLESTFKKSRSEGFGPEVKRRIMLGTFVLSEGYYDAYYTKAQRVRRFIQQKTKDILAQYDAIILPTTPTVAFKFGEKADNPLAMYMADIFTVQANITGMPAVSIPGTGLIDDMPWGIQLMAEMKKDAELLNLAQEIKSQLI